ncbi:hypothetical protein ATZ33_11805 [Enterococcus silesiacus]|nr:hypothetical protein [Enterococcus silesiacus]ALS02044.1 hypothetical protein ATZ33_11805 [Enterococcus silesiacus]
MAYAFTEGKEYKIDYSKIKKTLIDQAKENIFHFDHNLETYLDSWIKLLQECESLSIEQILTNTQHYQIVETFRIFHQDINYDGQKIKIHFNAELIANEINYSQATVHSYEVSDFSDDNAQFLWTKTEDSIFPLSESPILAVPFKSGFHTYLVIDGNHRVTEWVKTHEKIPVILLRTNDPMLNQAIFSSIFDEMFYTFIFDCHIMSIYRNLEPNLPDGNLFSKSYLNTGVLDDTL